MSTSSLVVITNALRLGLGKGFILQRPSAHAPINPITPNQEIQA
jgi:hypothetical protein